MLTNSKTDSIRQHYEPVAGNSDLVARITEILNRMDGPISSKQLAPLDQFHVKGLAGTKELAEMAGIQRDMILLDAGSGLGGSSRYLAETYGCRVVGVDLTPSYVDLANALTTRIGLESRVTYQLGDLLALPCADSQFDLVWTQHVAMNIGDRDRLYKEFARVLKPGGRLAFHDLYAPDDKPDLLFPLPWAENKDTGFLLTKNETIEALNRAGFTNGIWHDDTEQSIAGLTAQLQTIPPTPQSLHLMAVVGTRIAVMAANVARNAKEGRLRAVMGVYHLIPAAGA